MASTTICTLGLRNDSGFPDDYLEPRWYAAYTCANHEKRVAEQLTERAVEHFLPLYQSARRWKDRRVQLHLPLFPGYVFVHLALRDRLQVLEIPRVVRLVGFNAHPTPLPESEIEAIRSFLVHGLRAEPHPYLRVGRRVRVVSGPLKNLEGIMVKIKNAHRLIISLDLIQRSINIEVGDLDLRPAN